MSRRHKTLCVLSVLLAGCSAPTADDLVKQSIRQWEQAAGVLETVKEPDGLDKADRELQAIAQEMIELNKQAAKLEMGADVHRDLARDNARESQAALKRFNDAARQVITIEGGKDVVLRFQRLASRKF